MYAIEFETTAINGIIRIPERYQAQLTRPLRVIILQDGVERFDSSTRWTSFEQSPKVSVKHLPEGFYHPVPVQTYAMITNRNDIYER